MNKLILTLVLLSTSVAAQVSLQQECQNVPMPPRSFVQVNGRGSRAAASFLSSSVPHCNDP